MGPRDADQAYIDFVLDHLPWLTGFLGTVVLDLTVRIINVEITSICINYRFFSNASV